MSDKLVAPNKFQYQNLPSDVLDFVRPTKARVSTSLSFGASYLRAGGLALALHFAGPTGHRDAVGRQGTVHAHAERADASADGATRLRVVAKGTAPRDAVVQDDWGRPSIKVHFEEEEPTSGE